MDSFGQNSETITIPNSTFLIPHLHYRAIRLLQTAANVLDVGNMRKQMEQQELDRKLGKKPC